MSASSERESGAKRLAAIKARSEAALAGPWFWSGNTASNSIRLATRHSGLIQILGPRVRPEEYIYDHWWAETLTPEEFKAKWCHDEAVLLPENQGADHAAMLVMAKARGLVTEDPGEDRVYDLIYDDDRARGWDELDADELRALVREANSLMEYPMDAESNDREGWIGQHLRWTRGMAAWPDLDFIVQEGKWLKSYRELARYEVLNGQTKAEAGLEPDAGPSNSPLYREDIVGIDTPEAELIAHAPLDIDWLLERVHELAEALGVCECPECGRAYGDAAQAYHADCHRCEDAVKALREVS